MRVDGQRKTIAVTAHKTKPDGTREVSHRIEKHPVLEAMRKSRQGKTYEDGTRKGGMPQRDLRTRTPKRSKTPFEAMTGQRSNAPVGANMMKTVAALRRARQQMREDARDKLYSSGAFSGDGVLERPAPRHANQAGSYMLGGDEEGRPLAGTGMREPWNAVNYPEDFAVPGYDQPAYDFPEYMPIKPVKKRRIIRTI